MTNTTTLYDQLLDAVSSRDGAVFRSRLWLAPGSGWEAPVLRPAVYADGLGKEQPGPIINEIRGGDSTKQVTILASCEARAHSIMEALRSLQDEGIALPLLELYLDYDETTRTLSDLLTDSFSANHHATDAYWREAVEPVGDESFSAFPRFWDASGSALNPQHKLQPADLLRLYPWALLTGYDPRSSLLSQPKTTNASGGQRRGRRNSSAAATAPTGPPDEPNDADDSSDEPPRGAATAWGKLIRSSILADIDGTFTRGVGLTRPARPNAVVYVSANGVDWTPNDTEAMRDENGTAILWTTKTKNGAGTKPGKPSMIGLDFVTPQKRGGPQNKGYPDVWANTIVLSSYLAIPRLKQLRFSQSPGTDIAARTLLASLAVAGIVIADESLSPRTDCDLTVDFDREHPVRREIVRHTGPVDVDIDYGAAVGLVRHAIARLEEEQSKSNEILWHPETIRLVASKALHDLIKPPQR